MEEAQKAMTTWIVDNNLIIQIGPHSQRTEWIDGKYETVREAIEMNYDKILQEKSH